MNAQGKLFFSWKQTASAVGLSFGSQQEFNSASLCFLWPTTSPTPHYQIRCLGSVPGLPLLEVLQSRIFGCHYLFLLIVASGLTQCLWEHSFFFRSFPPNSSGTFPVKQKTLCKRSQSQQAFFFCLIICGFELLINAACTLEFPTTPASYSGRLAGTGGVVGGDPSPVCFRL